MITPVESSTLTIRPKRLLTSDKVFLVLLNVEDDRARHRDFGDQVEVSKDKENFARVFVLKLHKLLVSNQIVTKVFLVYSWCLVVVALVVLLHIKLLVVLTIAKREDVKVDLDHENWEVKFSKLKVYMLKLRASVLVLVRLGIVDLFAGNSLVYRDLILILHVFSRFLI